MKRPGESLIEVMITIAIMAVGFVILGAVFLAQGRYLDQVNASSETQYNAFQVLDAVGLFASSARAVVASRTINGRSYVSGTNTVVLAMPSIDASGALIANSTDYVAFGLFQSDRSKFMYDVDAATNSRRVDGQFVKAALVDKLIFRYNAVIPSNANAVDLFVRTAKTVRGQILRTPLGKIYYLGSS